VRRFVFALCVVLSLAVVGGATAGTGGNKTGQACYKGLYISYQDPSTGQPFASQTACVSFVANGGTLIPEVDLSITSRTPSSLFFLGNNDPWPGSADVLVHNGGAVAATVTVSISLQYLNSNLVSYVARGCFQEAFDQANQLVAITCSASLAAGATYSPFTLAPSLDSSTPTLVNIVASVSSTSPDPNTSNNVTRFSVNTPSV
jgi:hypothetical protein